VPGDDGIMIEQSVSSYHEARSKQNELQKQIAALKSIAAQVVHDEKLSEMFNKIIETS
jgi:vesicle coat complex subunit